MRAAACGVLVGASLILALGGLRGSNDALAQRPPDSQLVAAPGELVVFSLPGTSHENRPQVVVVDPQTKVMSVYAISASTGDIALQCVRKLEWDLQIESFNGISPLPREIRSQFEH